MKFQPEKSFCQCLAKSRLIATLRLDVYLNNLIFENHSLNIFLQMKKKKRITFRLNFTLYVSDHLLRLSGSV